MKHWRIRTLGVLFAVCFGGMALLGFAAIELRAQPILQVIDIRPIFARHTNIGNSLGLAFDPQRNVFYLAHGSDSRGGFIYTLDAQGNFLTEYDLQSAYQPGSFVQSLSYDVSTRRLFVLAAVPAGQFYVDRFLEMDPGTFTVLSDRPIYTGGDGIHVRADGIWQVRFDNDTLLHLSRTLALIGDVSVGSIFPGFPGPYALTSSFRDGFFIVDFFGFRIVEVNKQGQELAEASTANFGGAGVFAIDVDRRTRRIFLLVTSGFIDVLSDDFIRN